jgi:hypothetical protein
LVISGVTTAAAIIATVFAAGAYFASWESVAEARRQANIAQAAYIAADRPWIKVAQPPRVRLDVRDGIVWFRTDVEVQNIGRSPAQHTCFHTELLPDASLDEQAAAAENLCQRAAAAGYPSDERLVFPNDQNTLWDITGISIETVREKRNRKLEWEENAAREMFGEVPSVVEDRLREQRVLPLRASFTLVGCITYAVSPRRVVGQTAFVYGINRACGLGPLGICTFDMNPPATYSGDDISVRSQIGGAFAR